MLAVKIRSVSYDGRKRRFGITAKGKEWFLPYSKVELRPSAADPIVNIYIDRELAREGFTYVLKSGREDSILSDQFLYYNRDPEFMRNTLLYRLSVEAQKRVASSGIAKREITRRLGTSAAQLYRLLDQTNYRKSIDQMLSLLQVLDCEVELSIRPKLQPWKKAA